MPQTTLGGIKENSQLLNVSKQSLGAWRKIQGIQKFWAYKKKPIQWCSKPNEENKEKEKEFKPNTEGHDRPFLERQFKKTKGQETSISDP